MSSFAYKNVTILLITIFVSSCVFFQEGIEEVNYDKTPLECAIKPTVSYDFVFMEKRSKQGAPTVPRNKQWFRERGAMEKELFAKVFMDSGVFESVNEDDPKADIHVTIERTLVTSEVPGWPSTLSIITLFIIPTAQSMDVVFEGKIAKEGESIDFYYYDEGTIIFWLPMFLLRPFSNYHQSLVTRYMIIANNIINKEKWVCMETLPD